MAEDSEEKTSDDSGDESFKRIGRMLKEYKAKRMPLNIQQHMMNEPPTPPPSVSPVDDSSTKSTAAMSPIIVVPLPVLPTVPDPIVPVAPTVPDPIVPVLPKDNNDTKEDQPTEATKRRKRFKITPRRDDLLKNRNTCIKCTKMCECVCKTLVTSKNVLDNADKNILGHTARASNKEEFSSFLDSLSSNIVWPSPSRANTHNDTSLAPFLGNPQLGDKIPPTETSNYTLNLLPQKPDELLSLSLNNDDVAQRNSTETCKSLSSANNSAIRNAESINSIPTPPTLSVQTSNSPPRRMSNPSSADKLPARERQQETASAFPSTPNTSTTEPGNSPALVPWYNHYLHNPTQNAVSTNASVIHQSSPGNKPTVHHFAQRNQDPAILSNDMNCSNSLPAEQRSGYSTTQDVSKGVQIINQYSASSNLPQNAINSNSNFLGQTRLDFSHMTQVPQNTNSQKNLSTPGSSTVDYHFENEARTDLTVSKGDLSSIYHANQRQTVTYPMNQAPQSVSSNTYLNQSAQAPVNPSLIIPQRRMSDRELEVLHHSNANSQQWPSIGYYNQNTVNASNQSQMARYTTNPISHNISSKKLAQASNTAPVGKVIPHRRVSSSDLNTSHYSIANSNLQLQPSIHNYKQNTGNAVNQSQMATYKKNQDTQNVPSNKNLQPPAVNTSSGKGNPRRRASNDTLHHSSASSIVPSIGYNDQFTSQSHQVHPHLHQNIQKSALNAAGGNARSYPMTVDQILSYLYDQVPTDANLSTHLQQSPQVQINRPSGNASNASSNESCSMNAASQSQRVTYPPNQIPMNAASQSQRATYPPNQIPMNLEQSANIPVSRSLGNAISYPSNSSSNVYSMNAASQKVTYPPNQIPTNKLEQSANIPVSRSLGNVMTYPSNSSSNVYSMNAASQSQKVTYPPNQIPLNKLEQSANIPVSRSLGNVMAYPSNSSSNVYSMNAASQSQKVTYPPNQIPMNKLEQSANIPVSRPLDNVITYPYSVSHSMNAAGQSQGVSWYPPIPISLNNCEQSATVPVSRSLGNVMTYPSNSSSNVSYSMNTARIMSNQIPSNYPTNQYTQHSVQTPFSNNNLPPFNTIEHYHPNRNVQSGHPQTSASHSQIVAHHMNQLPAKELTVTSSNGNSQARCMDSLLNFSNSTQNQSEYYPQHLYHQLANTVSYSESNSSIQNKKKTSSKRRKSGDNRQEVPAKKSLLVTDSPTGVNHNVLQSSPPANHQSFSKKSGPQLSSSTSDARCEISYPQLQKQLAGGNPTVVGPNLPQKLPPPMHQLLPTKSGSMSMTQLSPVKMHSKLPAKELDRENRTAMSHNLPLTLPPPNYQSCATASGPYSKPKSSPAEIPAAGKEVTRANPTVKSHNWPQLLPPPNHQSNATDSGPYSKSQSSPAEIPPAGKEVAGANPTVKGHNLPQTLPPPNHQSCATASGPYSKPQSSLAEIPPALAGKEVAGANPTVKGHNLPQASPPPNHQSCATASEPHSKPQSSPAEIPPALAGKEVAGANPTTNGHNLPQTLPPPNHQSCETESGPYSKPQSSPAEIPPALAGKVVAGANPTVKGHNLPQTSLPPNHQSCATASEPYSKPQSSPAEIPPALARKEVAGANPTVKGHNLPQTLPPPNHQSCSTVSGPYSQPLPPPNEKSLPMKSELISMLQISLAPIDTLTEIPLILPEKELAKGNPSVVNHNLPQSLPSPNDQSHSIKSISMPPTGTLRECPPSLPVKRSAVGNLTSLPQSLPPPNDQSHPVKSELTSLPQSSPPPTGTLRECPPLPVKRSAGGNLTSLPQSLPPPNLTSLPKSLPPPNLTSLPQSLPPPNDQSQPVKSELTSLAQSSPLPTQTLSDIISVLPINRSAGGNLTVMAHNLPQSLPPPNRQSHATKSSINPLRGINGEVHAKKSQFAEGKLPGSGSGSKPKSSGPLTECVIPFFPDVPPKSRLTKRKPSAMSHNLPQSPSKPNHQTHPTKSGPILKTKSPIPSTNPPRGINGEVHAKKSQFAEGKLPGSGSKPKSSGPLTECVIPFFPDVPPKSRHNMSSLSKPNHHSDPTSTTKLSLPPTDHLVISSKKSRSTEEKLSVMGLNMKQSLPKINHQSDPTSKTKSHQPPTDFLEKSHAIPEKKSVLAEGKLPGMGMKRSSLKPDHQSDSTSKTQPFYPLGKISPEVPAKRPRLTDEKLSGMGHNSPQSSPKQNHQSDPTKSGSKSETKAPKPTKLSGMGHNSRQSLSKPNHQSDPRRSGFKSKTEAPRSPTNSLGILSPEIPTKKSRLAEGKLSSKGYTSPQSFSKPNHQSYPTKSGYKSVTKPPRPPTDPLGILSPEIPTKKSRLNEGKLSGQGNTSPQSLSKPNHTSDPARSGHKSKTKSPRPPTDPLGILSPEIPTKKSRLNEGKLSGQGHTSPQSLSKPNHTSDPTRSGHKSKTKSPRSPTDPLGILSPEISAKNSRQTEGKLSGKGSNSPQSLSKANHQSDPTRSGSKSKTKELRSPTDRGILSPEIPTKNSRQTEGKLSGERSNSPQSLSQPNHQSDPTKSGPKSKTKALRPPMDPLGIMNHEAPTKKSRLTEGQLSVMGHNSLSKSAKNSCPTTSGPILSPPPQLSPPNSPPLLRIVSVVGSAGEPFAEDLDPAEIDDDSDDVTYVETVFHSHQGRSEPIVPHSPLGSESTEQLDADIEDRVCVSPPPPVANESAVGVSRKLSFEDAYSFPPPRVRTQPRLLAGKTKEASSTKPKSSPSKLVTANVAKQLTGARLKAANKICNRMSLKSKLSRHFLSPKKPHP